MKLAAGARAVLGVGYACNFARLPPLRRRSKRGRCAGSFSRPTVSVVDSFDRVAIYSRLRGGANGGGFPGGLDTCASARGAARSTADEHLSRARGSRPRIDSIQWKWLTFETGHFSGPQWQR